MLYAQRMAQTGESSQDLFEVHSRELFVGAQPHPEVARVSPTCAPAVGVDDHAVESVVGVDLDRECFNLMTARLPAPGPRRVSVDETCTIGPVSYTHLRAHETDS